MLAAAAAVFVVGMVVQFPGEAYLRGDGSYYLRDASRLADGHLPQSRYSPGFAFVLAPIVSLLGRNYSAAGMASIALNIVFAVAAFVLLFGFLRTWLEPVVAATSVAVFALSQGVLTYFAEVRPEALCLLLLTGMLTALKRGRPGVGVVLGGLAMVVRIALAPVVLVTLAVAAWRRPKLLAAMAAAFALAGVAYLMSQSRVEDSYFQIGVATRPDMAPLDRIGSLLSTARLGVVHYGRFGLPRLFLPFGVLDTAAGIVLGTAVTCAMAVGVFLLLRRRPLSRPLLLATVAGFTVYLLTLLAWSIRPLSAVRLLTPAPVVPMLGLAAAVLWLAGQVATRREHGAAVAMMGLLAVVSAAGSVAAIPEHVSDEDRGGKGFVTAHTAVRDSLPVGVLMSPRPGASELLTGRRAVAYPLLRDVDEYARRIGVCVAVLSPEVEDDAARWVATHRGRILASVGRTEVVTVRRPWCPESA